MNRHQEGECKAPESDSHQSIQEIIISQQDLPEALASMRNIQSSNQNQDLANLNTITMMDVLRCNTGNSLQNEMNEEKLGVNLASESTQDHQALFDYLKHTKSNPDDVDVLSGTAFSRDSVMHPRLIS